MGTSTPGRQPRHKPGGGKPYSMEAIPWPFLPPAFSDIDDLMPALCAYQIEWNKMHKRLEGTALGQNLKSGLIKASAIGDKLKTTLGMSSADHEMLAKVWGGSLG